MAFATWLVAADRLPTDAVEPAPARQGQGDDARSLSALLRTFLAPEILTSAEPRGAQPEQGHGPGRLLRWLSSRESLPFEPTAAAVDAAPRPAWLRTLLAREALARDETPAAAARARRSFLAWLLSREPLDEVAAATGPGDDPGPLLR